MPPPPPPPPTDDLPGRRQFDASPVGLWVAFKSATREGEFIFNGSDPSSREFAREFGEAIFDMSTRPEASDERFQQDALAATDMLNLAARDDSSLLSFLYAA